MKLCKALKTIKADEKLNCFEFELQLGGNIVAVKTVNEHLGDGDWYVAMNRQVVLFDNGDIRNEDGTILFKKTEKLSRDGKYDFMLGFTDGMPEEYDLDTDRHSSFPWCAPWEYTKRVYIKNGLSPYDMGKRWANVVKSEWIDACNIA